MSDGATDEARLKLREGELGEIDGPCEIRIYQVPGKGRRFEVIVTPVRRKPVIRIATENPSGKI